MSNDTKKDQPNKAKPKAVKARTASIPRATVPPKVGPAFSRPVAAAGKKPRTTPVFSFTADRGTLTAKVIAADEAELTIFGAIGFDWFGDGITAKAFDDAVKAVGKVSTLRVRANSGGGDVFEGTQIYNILVKYAEKNSAKVVFEIEGVAASAMTLICMSGDEIRISENAHWMIHRASGGVWGNDDDVESYLKLLRNANELLRLTYSKRTGLSDAELVDMMRTDNWMTAQEALDHGFVDALDEAKTVQPHVEPDEPEDEAQRPVQITSDRLAAMAASLAAMAASAGHRVAASATPKTNTGDSPQTVTPPKKEPEMNAKLRAKCVAAGMPETLTGDAADKWCDDNFDKVMAPANTTAAAAKPGTVVGTDGATATGLNAEQILDLLEARDKKRADARKAWIKEVDANLALAFPDHVPATLKDSCYELQGDGIDAVRTKILEAKKKSDDVAAVGGPRVNFTDNQPRERHLAAIRAGVMVRSMKNFVAPAPRLVKNGDGRWEYVTLSTADMLEKHLPEKDRPKDWQSFSQMPLIKIAEECLLVDGLTNDQIRRLPAPALAMAAMGYIRQAGISAAAIHTTGSLLEITRDAINKSLTAGYEEAPQTWRGPFRQGTSVSDFKDIHRVKLGAAGNLPVWVDNLPPEPAKLSNEKEKYAVEAYAETLSFSWRLLINDDLNAISRHPQLLGDAAGRTVNAVAWRQATSNPTMADGQTLFLATPAGNRKRSNLTTGAATPTNATLGAMKAKMRLMRGLNTPEGAESEDILNLTPTFLMAPASLEEVVLKQIFSGADPAASGNSGVYNTARTLQPVIEPLLDAASTTAWYLSASPNRIDTIEVTFLQGQETPFAHEWMDDETMCQNYTIIQTFGAKALDHRGLQKHDGA